MEFNASHVRFRHRIIWTRDMIDTTFHEGETVLIDNRRLTRSLAEYFIEQGWADVADVGPTHTRAVVKRKRKAKA